MYLINKQGGLVQGLLLLASLLVYEELQSIYILKRLVIVNEVGNFDFVYKKKECLRFYQINLPTQLALYIMLFLIIFSLNFICLL